jgi:hypothetical protein
MTALVYRLFGFGTVGIRALSLVGAFVLCSGASLIIFHLTGTSLLAVIGFVLIALSPEVGSRATSGRMDTFTVGILLFAIFLTLQALNENRSIKLVIYLIGSGLLWSITLLSTPRSFPLITAFFLSGFLLNALHRKSKAICILFFIGLI